MKPLIVITAITLIVVVLDLVFKFSNNYLAAIVFGIGTGLIWVWVGFFILIEYLKGN